MRRQAWLTPAALIASLILAAALIDAAAIVTRPLRPYLTWMLP